jgi:hypothetical protein
MQNLHADILLYVIIKREYNSLTAEHVHVVEHRLSVTGFSPQRQLVSDIFRADNNCVHQISNGLLIGSVAFLILAPLSLSLSYPAGFQSPDPYSTWD